MKLSEFENVPFPDYLVLDPLSDEFQLRLAEAIAVAIVDDSAELTAEESEAEMQSFLAEEFPVPSKQLAP